MKPLLIVFLFISTIMLSGCSSVNSKEQNQERIDIFKMCSEAGMDTQITISGNLSCSPKK